MRPLAETQEASSGFRRKATLGLAVAGVLILSPFAVNNLLQGRPLLGAGSLAIVAILAYYAWSIPNRRYSPWLILLGLVPAILFFLVLAFRRQEIIGALWCYPAVLSFYIMLPERKAWVANAALLVIVMPQAWYVLEQPVAIRIAATLVAVSTFSAVLIRVITEQQGKLERLAATDPLTGLLNRKLLHETLDRAAQQNHRGGLPMTLLALDLDHFKAINDSLGHEAGDSVLRSVGEILRARLRRVDQVFRLGGEEFLVLLYDTAAESALRVAEELRRTFESRPLIPERTVTVSIGAAALRPGEDPAEWMRRADENLYQAKLQGRNRVVA